VFSSVAHPKNSWWPPCIFFNCPSKKGLAVAKPFLQLHVEKMHGGCRTFSSIAHLEDAYHPQGVFCLLLQLVFKKIIQRLLLRIFCDFFEMIIKKGLVVARHFCNEHCSHMKGKVV
jgi:hypothetical protein